jgi:tetratricopeptide (TPR) repeat protein
MLITQANQALKEQQLDKAFELYNQANNLLLQLSGVMNDDVATCITQIAAIQFKFGDFLQAIELQTRAIVLLERLHGFEHP